VKTLKWLWRRAWLLLFFVGAVLGWMATRRFSPVQRAREEKDAINAQEKSELLAADRGADMANAMADMEYRETLDKIGAKERKLVDDLVADPGRRVRLLNRLSRRLD
jgi:hypothetical protein